MDQLLRKAVPFLACAAFSVPTLAQPRPAQCYVDDSQRKSMKGIHTNIYVWGEGYQVDASQIYSNFTPKKIRNFEGAEKPDIIDMAFGWYHEAYIDKQGRLYICEKTKMSSVKIVEIKDGVRNPMSQVASLPKGAKVRQVSFIRNRMFVLTEDGKLYSFRITEKAPERDPFASKKPRWTGEIDLEKPIFVKDLPPLTMIATGQDHFLGLDKKGQVWAMGDDTFGQCGQGGEGRAAMAPFTETRLSRPKVVQLDQKVTKIVSGFRHSLAITESGQLYGWGFNSMQQLSNSGAYMDPDAPQQAIFEPQVLGGELERKFVVDAAAGEEHTVVVSQIRRDGKPISELVYACGNNLKGQLGINRTSHLNDFTLVEDISELYDAVDEQQVPLHIKKLSCGRRHCMAAFDYGAFFFWGDNEAGQLGNRKRSFIESPFPKKKFELHHNVEHIICADNSTAVIVEQLPPRKKKERKPKKTITLAEVQQSEAQLKAENEARMAALSKKEAKELETTRIPLSERMRGKFFGAIYGRPEKDDEKDDGEVKKD